ncbi:type IV toxin-antitoxin system AbiEi family antitoxin domain-containing protein [Allopusillimonas ginsengisoli]|uniref:type IV toxin-antitoxin system AbiEi family antitoxin domain-containing protein n=1 Tax=Allopusillimonas ginsengisoli TaxID=453575 RepID=UPI00101F6992|nr:hypothetical protein [Allopusillimonas ginsengisoli]TEA78769.1 hypothetical protein ERE07_05005 [Allopusillimonas ginsengisoli]
MAAPSRLQIAKKDIVAALTNGPRVLRADDIARLLNQNRDSWRLARRTTLQNFIDFLIEKGKLKAVKYPFPQREVTGYTWGSVSLYETLMGLVDRGFYSHYTALRIHGLTEQVPKTIYINREKAPTSHVGNDGAVLYEQKAIDQAFKNPPRITKNEIELPEERVRIVMLQSANHGGLGITEGIFNDGSDQGVLIRYTNLERTMIDVVTRPFYSGGVAEVAKAFENAKGTLAVNKLSAMLKTMKFGYPYHQAIGFYLERAGYKDSLVEIFRRQPIARDFYLAYGLQKTTFDAKWRLHIPQGF